MLINVKKIIGLILISFLLLFTPFKQAYARDLSFEDVVDALKNSDMYSSLESSGVSLNISSTSDKITITSNTYVTEFTYADDIISYTSSGSVTDDESAGQSVTDSLWIAQLILIIGENQGYTEEELSSLDITDTTYTLVENGLEVTTFDYSYTTASGTASGTVCDTFKININYLDLDLGLGTTQTTTVKPTIEFDNVKYNSITVTVSANVEAGKTCNLYRSTNGSNYELLAQVDCKNGASYTDNNIEANKIYYYRADVGGNANYSGVILATTPGITSNEEKIEKSPDTGISYPIFGIVILLTTSIFTIVYLRKKNLFHKV